MSIAAVIRPGTRIERVASHQPILHGRSLRFLLQSSCRRVGVGRVVQCVDLTARERTIVDTDFIDLSTHNRCRFKIVFDTDNQWFIVYF